MISEARSLNLSNSIAIGVYEVLRQWDFPALSRRPVACAANAAGTRQTRTVRNKNPYKIAKMKNLR